MADLNANQAAFKLLTGQTLTTAEETELRTKLNIASGVDEFSELLDNGTADLPRINVPLSSALDSKADSAGLATVATTGSYNDLIDTPTLSAGGVTQYGDLSDSSSVNLPSVNLPLSSALVDKVNSGDLSTVATTGDYDDLSNKPNQIYTQPVFLGDPSLTANATATTAAIQAVLDTRGRVYLPDGTYKLNGTFHLKTQGQIIEGESPTRTILEWITDVHGFEIDNSTESSTTNFPGSSVESSSWGAIRNLMVIGPVGSTKKAITNTEDPSGTLWIGEGWRYDFLTIFRWGTGIYSSSAARLNSRSINIKSCDKGLHLETGGSATNNCHIFYGITVSQCDIGIDLTNVRSGWFHIQDTSGNRIDVNASGCIAHIEGGQCESYSERFLVADNSCRLTVSNVNCLASTTIIPISVNGSSSVKIENCQNVMAGNTAEIAELLDAGSVVFGTANLHLAGSIPGNSPTTRVKQSNGDSVFLCPVPWRNGISGFSAEEKHRGVLYWRGAVGANNINNDDLEGVIEMNGGFVRAHAFKRNTFSVNVATTNYTLQGFEDVVLMDATVTRTVTLRASNSVYYRASANMRVFTIVDSGGNAGANNITINANGSDTINGSSSFVINEDYGSVTLATTGDGNWHILDQPIPNDVLISGGALGTPSSGDLQNCTFPTLNQNTIGNAATATALETGRDINGVTFDGTAPITITAAAGTLTGTTLNATVTGSSLTSLGTITSGTWNGTVIADAYIASAATWNAKGAAGQVSSHVGPVNSISTTWDIANGHSGSTTMTSSAKTITLSNLADGYEASLTVIGAATTGALTLAHAGLTVKGTIDTTSLTTGDECIIGIKRSGSSLLINQSPTFS